LGLESLELLAHNLNGLSGLTLLEALTAAPDDADTVVSGELGLGGNHLVGLLEDGAALRVAQDGPVDVAVLELGDGDFASEGAAGLVEDVLGGHLNAGADAVTDELEVQGRRRNNDLCSWKV
jgi:hypothetical protein